MRSRGSELFGTIYFPAMALTTTGGMALFVIQCVSWLQTGDWPEIPLSVLWGDTDSIRWRGLAKIIDFLGEVGLAPAIVFTSLASFLIAEPFMNWMDGEHKS